MPFWTFNQNNSGGSFDFDKERGITHFVIVEADTREMAVNRAEEIGIYFDGCSSGRDCSCCGDRWSAPWEVDGDASPSIYGADVRAAGAATLMFGGWMEEGFEAAVHPLSGPIEWYGARREAAA